MRNSGWIIVIAFRPTGVVINSPLAIDLYQVASTSTTAVNNLMRCLAGAGMNRDEIRDIEATYAGKTAAQYISNMTGDIQSE